jgi:hypothetical protein
MLATHLWNKNILRASEPLGSLCMRVIMKMSLRLVFRMHEYVPFQITQALCTHDAAPLMLSHPHEDKGCTKPTTACEAGPTDYGQDTSLHNELRVAASRAKYDVQGCAYKHGRKVTRAFATSSRKCFQVVQQDEQDRLVDIP